MIKFVKYFNACYVKNTTSKVNKIETKHAPRSINPTKRKSVTRKEERLRDILGSSNANKREYTMNYSPPSNKTLNSRYIAQVITKQ